MSQLHTLSFVAASTIRSVCESTRLGGGWKRPSAETTMSSRGSRMKPASSSDSGIKTVWFSSSNSCRRDLAGIGRVAVSVTVSNSTASQLLPIAAMPVALPSKGAESDACRDTAEATVADATDAETP